MSAGLKLGIMPHRRLTWRREVACRERVRRAGEVMLPGGKSLWETARQTMFACRWGDSPLRWMECMLFLNVANETKEFKFDYQQDHTSGWEEPLEWGIRQVRAAK